MLPVFLSRWMEIRPAVWWKDSEREAENMPMNCEAPLPLPQALGFLLAQLEGAYLSLFHGCSPPPVSMSHPALGSLAPINCLLIWLQYKDLFLQDLSVVVIPSFDSQKGIGCIETQLAEVLGFFSTGAAAFG